jgi:mercuric ion transport protein
MNTNKLMGAGIFSAIAASLCCITPVLALIAGSGSIASSFTWIEPARPYLIGLTIVVLSFTWFQKLKPKPIDDCGCEVAEKHTFIHSKTFLFLVTLFATLMIAFPSYAKMVFPKIQKAALAVKKSNIQTAELNVKGMSCEACEAEINLEVNKLPGIIQTKVSYQKGNALIQFDASQTTINKISDAIDATGYKVISQSVKN